MIGKLKIKYQKYTSDKEINRVEREKQRRIKERNKKILKVAKFTSLLICVFLFAYFYIQNPDGFKMFVEKNFLLLLIPIWIYLVILFVLESIRAFFEIIFFTAIFAIFGVFAFLIIGVVSFIIEELFIELGTDIISELFF